MRIKITSTGSSKFSFLVIFLFSGLVCDDAFNNCAGVPPRLARFPDISSSGSISQPYPIQLSCHLTPKPRTCLSARKERTIWDDARNVLAVTTITLSILLNHNVVRAEDELAAKYGNGKSFDSSLVDQTCLVNSCSLQAKACLQDDPSCRKGLTCTAKCMGDNACITGCFARYGNQNLDNLLKCSVEDNECIKIAILEGGADAYGHEPMPPARTVERFDTNSLEGTWYKVVGFNPNYDCYACQKNTFSSLPTKDSDKLQIDVQFAMPHLLPDGSPTPPSQVQEKIVFNEDRGQMTGPQSIAYNEYSTHETMVFDAPSSPSTGSASSDFFSLLLPKASTSDNVVEVAHPAKEYARTAHSEGEMFGLKFWENWYVIGENDPNDPEFKFIYYNGKTRQNTYEGAFVYSRNKELDPISMRKVYRIASEAGLKPDNFCRIQNSCFDEKSNTDSRKKIGIFDSLIEQELLEASTDSSVPKMREGAPSNPILRKVMSSTKISQLLGVETVSAKEDDYFQNTGANALRQMEPDVSSKQRAWWYEVGDYLENPHRHFRVMNNLRMTMDWPEEVKQ